jgi:hypothetical protein
VEIFGEKFGKTEINQYLCIQFKNMDDPRNIIYWPFCMATAMIGYNIHGSTGWAIVDFLLSPLVWCKWLIYHEVTLKIIEESFSWFFK